MSKPSKSPNLTAIEKSALLELIKSKKDVIENKQNFIKKNSEWEKIRDEFDWAAQGPSDAADLT